MSRQWELSQFQIDPLYFLLCAFALLVIPFRWMCAWCAALLIHELFHYLAIKSVAGSVYGVDITADGIVINTDISGGWQEAVCAIAGPIGSLLLIFTAGRFPRLAVCGLFHGIYNLIPVYPLDGGRVLHTLLEKIPFGKQIEQWIGYCIHAVFLIAGVYGALCLKLGIFPLIFVAILIRKNYRGKYTCKERRFGLK